MAYDNFDLGAFDANTGRGALWRALTAPELAALRAELAKTEYASLSDHDAALLLLSRERTGATTRTVSVPEAARRDVIGAAGGVTFLVALKAAANANSALMPVYDYIMSEDTYVPADPAFQTALALLNSIVIDAQSTKLLPDANKAAIIALGQSTVTIPDAERPVGPSRAESAGLPGLLITADDVHAARSN